MRNRLQRVSGAHPASSRRRKWICLLVFLLTVFFGSEWFADTERATATDAPPVHLVRLVLTTDDGFARIEIVADSALSETAIQRFTRGGETVIRIRGARSLLRPAYSASDIVMRNVRTSTGETNGEPFVDIAISLVQGDALAPRRSFNRLVIGITNEVARERQIGRAHV